MVKKYSKAAVGAVSAAAVLALAACSSGGGGSPGAGGADGDKARVLWWTWTSEQMGSYQKCADVFEAENPDIDVVLEAYAWDDYWTKITTGFVGGNAPDAFMNHPSWYPEFAAQGQLLPLDEYIAADNFDVDKYAVGAETWGAFPDGHRYGLQKDWSTLGLFYNAEMVEEAGLAPGDLAEMTWNPSDGGTFEDVIARLTVDENGVRGDEPGFDPRNVAVYGMSTLTGGGINGQETWAQFAPTTGWTLADERMWPTTFQYSDPLYTETAEWIMSLVEKGYTPGFGQVSLGLSEQLGSGTTAMIQSGSWSAAPLSKLDGVEVVTVPSVIGPEGRAALSGSMADSIWARTQVPEQTWRWISYMGTEECQTLAGADGWFMPSIPESMAASEAALAEQGIDLSPFTVHLEDGTLWETPLYTGGTEVESTIAPLGDSFWSGTADSSVFATMDERSREILGKQRN